MGRLARIGLGIMLLLAGLWAVALIPLWHGSDNVVERGDLPFTCLGG
jgi:hypothetical protein